MQNLRLSTTFLLVALIGGCQQAPVASAPAPTVADSAPPASAAPATSGTAAGSRVLELRDEAQQLQSSIDEHLARLSQIRQERETVATQYYADVDAIGAKLRQGTTPSNPVMTEKWADARGLLDKLEENLSRVTALANDMAADGQTGAYLDDSTRAVFAMPGALDEDHAELRALQADVAASQSRISSEMIEVTNEINRQNAALGIERNNIATLAEGVRTGQFLGHSLANAQQRPPAKSASAHEHGKARHPAKAAASAAPAPGVAAGPAPVGSPAVLPTLAAPSKPDKRAAKSVLASGDGRRAPLMVIRFDRYQERYDEALYRAVSRTLEAQPNARFRIVGVTPAATQADDAAARLGDVRRHVEDVQRSLLAFGLAPARIASSSEASGRASVEEVRIYRQ